MPLTVLSVAFPLAAVSPGTAGGAEQILLTIDRALVRHGHRSLVVAAAGSKCAGLLFPVQIPSGELNEAAKHEARQQFQQAIDHALTNFQVDIVHMHGLDFHEYLPEGDVPVAVTLHLPLDWYAHRTLHPRRSSTHLICVSHSQAATLAAGVQIEAVVSNGVELQEYSFARRKGSYALIMGRVCPEKGIHLALDAARDVGIPVLVAGSVFPYREHETYFEREVRPRLSSRVRFVDAVGRERKAMLLAGAKCLLIASQAQETSSLVAMEALASGTPVIAWRNGALPEIITHGRTGWLVSSVEEMTDAIRRVDAISPAECRLDAQQRFCSERMTKEYFSLYRRLTNVAETVELQAA